MNGFIKYYWPAILWALFVLIMCSVKLGEVSESPLFFPGFDKLVHCGFFFVIIVFITAGYIRQQSIHTLSYQTLLVITLSQLFMVGLLKYFKSIFLPGAVANGVICLPMLLV